MLHILPANRMIGGCFISSQIDHFFDAHRVGGSNGRTQPACDPAAGQRAGPVDLPDMGEVRQSVGTALLVTMPTSKGRALKIGPGTDPDGKRPAILRIASGSA